MLVPPVGFEPTLRTLLGGRPLPLGYGGALIVTRFWLSIGLARPSIEAGKDAHDFSISSVFSITAERDRTGAMAC